MIQKHLITKKEKLSIHLIKKNYWTTVNPLHTSSVRPLFSKQQQNSNGFVKGRSKARKTVNTIN